MGNFIHNNTKASDFLTVLLAEMKRTGVTSFDVAKFVNVVMRLKNTSDFANVLSGFSDQFEECQSQMIQVCSILQKMGYIKGDTIYELHFLKESNFDTLEQNIPNHMDKALLSRFFQFMQILQKKIQQNTISEQNLLDIILYNYKGNVESQDVNFKDTVQDYLSTLSEFGFLTISSVYSVNISDSQLETILKNYRREKFKNTTTQIEHFLLYYNHPEKLNDIPANVKKIQPKVESLPNRGNVKEKPAKPVSQTMINQDVVFPTIKPFTPMMSTENSPAMFPEPVQFMPIRSRHTYFKSEKSVLLAFLAMIQSEETNKFDKFALEQAMNEIARDQNFYEFPRHFRKFAEQYVGTPLKKSNLYKVFDELNRKHLVKRKGDLCLELKFSEELINKCLNALREEDYQKIAYLAEQYLTSLHKMSR